MLRGKDGGADALYPLAKSERLEKRASLRKEELAQAAREVIEKALAEQRRVFLIASPNSKTGSQLPFSGSAQETEAPKFETRAVLSWTEDDLAAQSMPWWRRPPEKRLPPATWQLTEVRKERVLTPP